MQEWATAAAPRSIATDEAPRAIGPYSQAVRSPCARALLFVSGQLPMLPGSDDAGGVPDLPSQYRRALENALAIVRAGGGTAGDVVKATIFLTDLAHYDEFNQVYADLFDTWRPARSVVQVASLPRGAPIEVELIAAVAEPGRDRDGDHVGDGDRRSDLEERPGTGRPDPQR